MAKLLQAATSFTGLPASRLMSSVLTAKTFLGPTKLQ